MSSNPHVIAVGQVYRKAGPCDWVKIVRILIPEFPSYDGAFPGVSVRFSTGNGGFHRQTWFLPARSEQDFLETMKKWGCELVRRTGVKP